MRRYNARARNSCGRETFTSNKMIGGKRERERRERGRKGAEEQKEEEERMGMRAALPELASLFLSRYRRVLRFLRALAAASCPSRAAGVLLTRRRMAINHGNWLAYGSEEEEAGFTRDCITGRGVAAARCRVL